MPQKYTAYSKPFHDSFAGNGEHVVIVSKNKVIAHFRTWDTAAAAAADDWDPTSDGLVGTDWKRGRPEGYRKTRPQSETVDWAVETLADLRS